jgi:hypothetical protein
MTRTLVDVQLWLLNLGESYQDYRYSEDQPRDEAGRFGEGGGAATGDSGDGGGGIGASGYDANGNTEYDLDSNGDPKFSQTYHDEYGHVVYESGGTDVRVAITDTGSLHIADDSHGTQEREVLHEFSDPQEAEALGEGIYAVYSGEQASYESPSGIQVEPAGDNPQQDGVNVTWSSSGGQTFLSGEAGGDEAFELQGALQGIAAIYAEQTSSG